MLAVSLLVAVRVMPRREPARTRSARPAPVAAVDVASQAEEPTVQEGVAAVGGGKETGEDGEDPLVDYFYGEIEKWAAADASSRSTVEDAASFAEKFKALPGGRKEECLQMALNLVPDENVMVLVGILMDKSQEREYVQLVFNDILNRPEDVKKPILEQILADGEHPCADDAAWIFEVTGEQARDLPQPTSD